MPFMVIFRRSDGSSGFEQADAIDGAALFVERLRNKDGIEDEDIRIYRMDEISFAFRPYYKVELGLPEKQVGGAPPPEVASPTRPTEDEPTPAPVAEAPVGADQLVDAAASAPDVDGDVGANGRRGLFGR
jgi:hypothetical protein